MTRKTSSPNVCAPVRARRRSPVLPAALALAATCGLFSAAQAQTGVSRPVARMIGSSRSAPSAYNVEPVASARAVCSNGARYAHAGAVRFAATGGERRAFEMINQERRSRGLAPLQWDADLSRLARGHSEEMGRGDYLSHTDSRGRDTFTRAASEGVCGWSALAENIAYNQGFDDPVAFAVERWMKSPKHRENILRAGFTHAGLGISQTADGRVYFTQVFITR
jgi:uncharacterized protein YkwD